VVVLPLREIAHAIHERERVREASELERPLERVPDLAPAFRNGHGRSMQ